MNLQEAYEIRRKENLSLKAENSRLMKLLESGSTVSAEKAEKLEASLRRTKSLLEKEKRRNRDIQTQYSRTQQFLREAEMQRDILQDEVDRLRSEKESLEERLEKAKREINDLNGRNLKLTKETGRSFDNSSVPSSLTPFRKQIPNSRKPSGKKPGGQKGHAPHVLSPLRETAVPVFLDAPEAVSDTSVWYPTGNTVMKQMIDVSFTVNVTNYLAQEFRNRLNGSRIHASFPEGAVNPVNYGPNLKAVAFMLNTLCNVSLEKTSRFISDLTGNVVNISPATVHKLSEDFSEKTAEERKKIFSRLVNSDILYSDATGCNINGKRKHVILCTDGTDVLYTKTDHKGHEGLMQTPVKDTDAVLVHDHDVTYYSYGSNHQECLAHVLRYLKGASELEQNLTWHMKMHDLIQEMIHRVKDKDRTLTGKERREFHERYEEILELAEKEYRKNPPSDYYRDGYNLMKRMKEYENSHLLFLQNPDVGHTNNISERGLRRFKTKQKQSTVFRSDSGGQFICDALTITESLRMQNRSIYPKILEVFSR